MNQNSDSIYVKLVEAPLYQTYKKAFRDATSLNLKLIPASADGTIAPQENTYLNPFCDHINDARSACGGCLKADKCIKNSPRDNATTITCFAGMRETAIPIRSGNQTVAYLTTGQVFTETPDPTLFSQIEQELRPVSDNESSEDLKEMWESTPQLSMEKYLGAVTILASFGLQLSELLNRIVIEKTTTEPDIVTKAKRYINANLEDKITLEKTAQHAGISSYYFCKLFKQHTGMTLTEYINRRRVEWAKRQLLDPRSRITEIAYDVGFQSLSQFNRSFSKYTGMSPSQFRKSQTVQRVSDAKIAA
ncbi:MAG: AraC family transcriptional regulator [Verrucomicrobiales bacterium]|nr:AraC family transcriptional regulator [Verrucomicrobiales bacterium]